MQNFTRKTHPVNHLRPMIRKKVRNLKLPRVLRTPTKITSPRQPLTVPESKETTPQGTHQPIKLKNKKPAHCSFLGMFDPTGLRGCLWWLFGSCIANCRGGGTKLGASEASEGLEDFRGLWMGWGDRKPKMRIFPLGDYPPGN